MEVFLFQVHVKVMHQILMLTQGLQRVVIQLMDNLRLVQAQSRVYQVDQLSLMELQLLFTHLLAKLQLRSLRHRHRVMALPKVQLNLHPFNSQLQTLLR